MIDSDPDHFVDWERGRRLARLAHVPRWTVIPTIQKQSVAEHSFNVAWLSVVVADYYRGFETPEGTVTLPPYLTPLTVWNALIHDEAEAISGDIASPYKRGRIGHAIREYEGYKQYGKTETGDLYPDIKKVIKIADCVEAWLFLKNEQKMGNVSAIPVSQDVKLNLIDAWYELFGAGADIDKFLNHVSTELNILRHPCLGEQYDIAP